MEALKRLIIVFGLWPYKADYLSKAGMSEGDRVRTGSPATPSPRGPESANGEGKDADTDAGGSKAEEDDDGRSEVGNGDELPELSQSESESGASRAPTLRLPNHGHIVAGED